MSKGDKPPTPNEPNTNYAIGVSVWFNGSGVVTATGVINGDDGSIIPGSNNGLGRLTFTFACPPVAYKWGGILKVQAEGFDDYLLRVSLEDGNFDITLQSSHVDPSKFDLETLAKIKGSMWCRRMNLPYGPRPNQDDNILAMDFYEEYDNSTRPRMIAEYMKYGNTHAVTGPLVDGDGYHGNYPTHPNIPTQSEFDNYLDKVQEWWDAGLAPIHFVHPDNWSFEDMGQLDFLYSQPRAQKLLRIVVYTGWEPTKYGWPNSVWVQFCQKGAVLFPNALRLLHTVTDTDAPTGGDDYLIPGFTNGTAWTNVAPFIHGWLVQNGGYFSPLDDRGNSDWNAQFENFKVQFAKQFNPDSAGSLTQRFRNPAVYGDWPKGSAFGPNVPLKVYAGEFAAYPNYWWNWPEDEARALAQLALSSGADGFLDGGC